MNNSDAPMTCWAIPPISAPGEVDERRRSGQFPGGKEIVFNW